MCIVHFLKKYQTGNIYAQLSAYGVTQVLPRSQHCSCSQLKGITNAATVQMSFWCANSTGYRKKTGDAPFAGFNHLNATQSRGVESDRLACASGRFRVIRNDAHQPMLCCRRCSHSLYLLAPNCVYIESDTGLTDVN